MKKLSKLCFGIGIGCLGIFLIGCHDAPIGDDFADKYYDPVGAVVAASNVQVGFFDIASPATSSIAFDLTAKGEAVSSVAINAAFQGGSENAYGTSSVPGTVNVTMLDALAAVGVSAGSVKIGDKITFTFDATTSSGTFRSSKSLTVPFSCFSNLGGTHDYVSTNLQAITGTCPAGPVTGQVTFTDLGGGKYLCSDLGFGQYSSTCWNDSPATSANATFTDVCNKITSGGLDQYGAAVGPYIWTITGVSGSELSISWFNGYNDSGDVVITREGGANWPALFTN